MLEYPSPVSRNAITLWIDADACPHPVQQVIFKTARRLEVPTVFVSNRSITSLPVHPLFSSVLVEQGPDVADAYIVANAQAGDLVVSQDVPLAAELVPQGIMVITPYGNVMEKHNISTRKAVRDMLTDMREAGFNTSGPKPFGPKDKERFTNALDKWLNRLLQA
jgi:uncharacterized protein